MEISTVAVVGAGLMGHAIAQEVAVSGHKVTLCDISEDALQQANTNIEKSLHVAAQLQLVEASEIPGITERIAVSTDASEAAAGADLVIEAVPENLDLKKKVFSQLDEAAPPEVVLASNTSSIPPDEIAAATARPERVVISHFFNPPYLIPLVEVVRGTSTSKEVVIRLVTFLKKMGNAPVVLEKAVPGFLINRLQIALLREALHLVESGVVSMEGLDEAVRNSIGRRLSVAGVFEVCDISGLDVVGAVAESVLHDLDGSRQVSPLITSRLEQGKLGIKTGQGFYGWSPETAMKTQGRIGLALATIKRWSQAR